LKQLDAIHSPNWKMKHYQIAHRFPMEKDDDKSWDIRGRFWIQGRLVLNENHRNKITHFTIKPLPILSK
jgi:hypothetical protein